ncbi:hypothetical protein PAXINDRAFT_157005 [Paxillus involutus ATCC 200175]|uniref:WD40 repeat-like protein n=1 Tax=Paxillus involutus ATCC 200175 TaxID=664439 RepID=A0A0C9TY64_PAXIN|nr:hypothetical protein PAXINDRAFT_157005 [Paxillus involutus ATCC 200175]
MDTPFCLRQITIARLLVLDGLRSSLRQQPFDLSGHLDPLYRHQHTCHTLLALSIRHKLFPDDLDPQHVPPEFKKEGSDWFAVFNPKVKRVLDVNLVHTLMHESVVCCVRFSADGKFLATGCNRTAQIYDTKTGAKTCVLADDYAGKAGDLYIRSVCFSPDGKYLATGAEDKQIRIWDIAKKRIRNVFDGHQQEVYSLDFSLDGRLLVSGSIDNTARIWDMVDGSSKVLRDPKMSDSYAGVNSVAISPNGQLVAVGVLGDDVVCIWDVASGVLIERLRGHRNSIFSVAFTPDGKGLVSGSLDKTLNYWDVSGLINGAKWKDAAANGKKELEKASQCTMNFIGHRDYVLSVAVSHNGQWVVSGSKDRGVRFWDSHTATVQCILQGHTNSGPDMNSIFSVAFTPDGKGLVSGSLDKTLNYWDVSGLINGAKWKDAAANGKKELEKASQCTMNFIGHRDYVLSVAVSHNGQWVVSGSKDRGVRFWDSHTATVQCILQGHTNSVMSIDMSPVGSMLATGSGDCQARICAYSYKPSDQTLTEYLGGYTAI